MNKVDQVTVEEARRHLGDLSPDAQVILVTSNDQIPVVLLKHAETLQIGDRVYKFLRNAACKIVAVWIFMLTMFPEITPTPIQIFKTVQQQVPKVIASIDFSFPLPVPDQNRPWIAFPDVLPNGSSQPGARYFVSGSGIAPQALV